MRGLRTIERDLNPLTPTLSPMGRGSPAVPQLESVLTGKVCVNKIGMCASLARVTPFNCCNCPTYNRTISYESS